MITKGTIGAVMYKVLDVQMDSGSKNDAQALSRMMQTHRLGDVVVLLETIDSETRSVRQLVNVYNQRTGAKHSMYIENIKLNKQNNDDA